MWIFFLFLLDRMSNMSDSAYGEDYESSSPVVTKKHQIQKSTSLVAPAPVKPPTSETTVIKHSKSSGKLERKVSFSEADPVKIGENGHHQQPSKPKRSKEKKIKSSTSSSSNVKGHNKKASPKDLGPKSESEFVDQVSAKLKVLEQQQKAAEANNNNLEISATVKLSPKSQPAR